MNQEKPIPSPCVNICALDENDVCIGCHRHGNEISRWGGYSNTQKQKVIVQSHRRSRGEILPALKC